MAKAEYRSSLRSKKLITDALVELLDEKTLDKITVTDIVKKAEKSCKQLWNTTLIFILKFSLPILT